MKLLAVMALATFLSTSHALKINGHRGHLQNENQPPQPQQLNPQNPEHPFEGDKVEISCQQDDFECWQLWASEQLPCEQEDTECWRQTLPQLPCRLHDTRCWKEVIPEIPCERKDKECWNELLPENVPCEIGDRECWREFKEQIRGNEGGEEDDDQERGRGDRRRDRGDWGSGWRRGPPHGNFDFESSEMNDDDEWQQEDFEGGNRGHWDRGNHYGWFNGHHHHHHHDHNEEQ